MGYTKRRLIADFAVIHLLWFEDTFHFRFFAHNSKEIETSLSCVSVSGHQIVAFFPRDTIT